MSHHVQLLRERLQAKSIIYLQVGTKQYEKHYQHIRKLKTPLSLESDSSIHSNYLNTNTNYSLTLYIDP